MIYATVPGYPLPMLLSAFLLDFRFAVLPGKAQGCGFEFGGAEAKKTRALFSVFPVMMAPYVTAHGWGSMNASSRTLAMGPSIA